MPYREQDVLILNSDREQLTPASLWHALAGSAITDEFLNWPADLFALTYVILERSEAYRFVLAPPPGTVWPPQRFPRWADRLEEAGRQWSVWVDDKKVLFPGLLADEWSVSRDRADTSLDELAEGHDWRMCEALLTLHAIADEACAGLGVTLDGSDGRACIYHAHGRELLARTDRWLESPPTSFASCPRFGCDRTGPRYPHSHATHACLTGG